MRSRQLSNSIALWALCMLVVGCGSLFERRKQAALPTVQGPEATDLVERIGKGRLVMDQPRGGIVAISLPGLEESTVRRPGEGHGTVHAVSGPDESGHIAYVVEYLQKKTYAIRVCDLDGMSDRLLLSGSGSPLWDHVVGNQIALHASNGKLAWLKESEGVQMREPSALLRVGQLVFTNLEDGKTVETQARAIDSHNFTRKFAWFPDGTRIAYVALTSRQDPAATTPPPPVLARDHDGWDRLPAVWVWDLGASTSRFVHWGWTGVPTADQKAMLVCAASDDAGLRWQRVDLSTGESELVSWPGASEGLIAALDGDLVIYWGYPTEGASQEWTELGSPLAPRWAMWSLKVAEVPTARFQTLLRNVDPRRSVDYGKLRDQAPTGHRSL
jgi:hypothetical protein